MTQLPAFTELPDLASRALGGSVVHANDELFAPRENLIRPEAPTFSPTAFGPKGKVYDGWETRRRREPGHDHAVVRLGVAGVLRGVVVDTSWFTGNYPPAVSLDATGVEGYPSPAELAQATWEQVVDRSAVEGNTLNFLAVKSDRRYTHVRLNIHPDGGIARLRVHGEPLPDPRLLTGQLDLAAAENGGRVVDCSDRFYSSPANLLLPGRARTMAEGWENARRRGGGNDHVTVRLAGQGLVDLVEVDTTCFVGNAPGEASLLGSAEDGAGVGLLRRTRLQPDTRHLFRVRSEVPVHQVRLDVYPDGGLARLRVHGRLTGAALERAVTRWLDRLPPAQAAQVLDGAGVSRQSSDLVRRLLG